ncbi:MAG: PhnD/SsuA/transferrin family substrate-binding protein [Marivibrio sp.]|uniref:PhnD/SsuA/transferrin family substrate-binding protein n=1 Tax=Marivibrio sp. TaxID=2039719 RepID=UPI0032EE9E5E
MTAGGVAAAGRAGLFMYAPEELRPTVEAWWAGLRGHLAAAGAAAPETLEWPRDAHEHWTAPDLVLSQTCGYPLTHALAGALIYVATPRYRAPGCAGADYCSLIVARAVDAGASLLDFEGRRLAVNGLDSQSGRHALRAAAADALRAAGRAAPTAPFFSGVALTGGHRESLATVRAGGADLCAVDAVTAALIRDVAPAEWSGLVEIARTPFAPGLPLVTAAGTSPEGVAALRRGLAAAVADPALAATRRRLRIDALEVLPPDAYARVTEMERDAAHTLPERLFHPRQ